MPLYDFGVSIASCGQKLEVRNMSLEQMLSRQIIELVKFSKGGQKCCERITYTSSDSLTDEPRACKAFRVRTLFELLSCESVSIGGKATVTIWLLEP